MSKHTLYQISTFALIAVLVGLFVYGTKKEDVKVTKAQTPAPNESLRYMMEMMDVALVGGSSSSFAGSEFVDLNGDGLADLLTYMTNFPTTSWPNYKLTNGQYQVYKNNGNNTYTKIYNCQWNTDYSYNPPLTGASGDCAHLAGQKEVPHFFSAYTSWPTSVKLNYTDPTYQMLNDGMVARVVNPNIFWVRASRFVDINSDGLVDMVYKQYDGDGISPREVQYAILLNNGDFTFTPAYKCFSYNIDEVISGYSQWYYGDCTGT